MMPVGKLLFLLFLTTFLNLTQAYAHDGDDNIFPGNAIALSANSKISNIVQKQALAGEIVPPEDSDKLPRLTKLIALEFQLDGEVYRYTHTEKSVEGLGELLSLLENSNNNQSKTTVHLTYYSGHSFRDGVHRISGFFTTD